MGGCHGGVRLWAKVDALECGSPSQRCRVVEQIDYNDPVGRQSAVEMLHRHDQFEPEANITSAIRQFLTQTGLAQSDEIVEENPPSDGSRRAVDLTALDTFIEVKRRIGTGAREHSQRRVRASARRLPAAVGSPRACADGHSHRREALAAALAQRGASQECAPLRANFE